MVIIYDETGKHVDERHVVDTTGLIYCSAVVVNSDGTYDEVFYYDGDDMRTWSNQCIIDATDEEKLQYRIYKNRVEVGDTVTIVKGRKMLNETKKVIKMFTFRPSGTYGHQDVDYLVFEDGTKVNRRNCIIVK